MPAGRVWTDASGSFQNSTPRTSPAKCQGGDGTSAAAPRGERGAVNPLSITSSPPAAARPRIISTCNVSAGVVPNAWTDVRQVGGLCAYPILTAKPIEPGTSHIRPKESGRSQRGRKLQTLTFRYKR